MVDGQRSPEGDPPWVRAAQHEVDERGRTKVTRANLAAMVECSDDAIIGTAMDGTITSWNSGAKRILGWSAADMIGTAAAALIPPEEQDKELRASERLKRGELLDEFDTLRLARDGRRVEVSVRLSNVRDETGAIVGASEIARDITPERHAEREVARIFFGLSAEMLCVTDFDGKFLRLNPAWEIALGYTREELLAEPYLNFVHPDDRAAAILEAARLASESAKPASFANRYRRRDGTYRWLLWSVVSVPAERLIYASAHDITERKQTEEALVETIGEAVRINHELSFQKFALDQHAMVSITDCEGRITYVNEKFCEISGFPREELIGQTHRIVNSGYHPKEFFDDLYATILHGRVWLGEIRNRAKDGRIYWADTTIVPFQNEKGKITRYVAIRTDITERRKVEAEVERVQLQMTAQNRRLEALTDQAHRFVDDVSHEFRTPLAVIKEFGAIISDGLAGAITPEQGQYLGIIDNAVLDLNQMVEDFLDSSKLRAGRLRVDRRAQLIDDIFARLRPGLLKKAVSRSITVAENIAPKLPLVFADEEKVRRVIMNLATNAVKFSPEGSQVELWARPAPEGGVEIGVTDHGRGLTSGDLAQLFERFKQIPNADAPGGKGFGLGLNIARQLVWLNLGKMNVVSDFGKGSTFSFTLPADDPRMILDRFFIRLAECDAANPSVAVISVSPAEPTEQQNALRLFLAATTRPSDVILEMPSKSERGLLVLGPTESADGWASRLSRVRDRAVAEAGAAKLGPLRIEILGTYVCPAGVSEATACVLGRFAQEPVCA